MKPERDLWMCTDCEDQYPEEELGYALRRVDGSWVCKDCLKERERQDDALEAEIEAIMEMYRNYTSVRSDRSVA